VTLFYRSSREVRRETSEIQMQRRVAPRRAGTRKAGRKRGLLRAREGEGRGRGDRRGIGSRMENGRRGPKTFDNTCKLLSKIE